MRKHPSLHILQLLLSILCLALLHLACSVANEDQDTNANSATKVKAKLVYFSIPG